MPGIAIPGMNVGREECYGSHAVSSRQVQRLYDEHRGHSLFVPGLADPIVSCSVR